MLVKAKTDDGDINFNPKMVTNFWPIALNKTAIEHNTNGELETVCVNHGIQQICAVITRFCS